MYFCFPVFKTKLNDHSIYVSLNFFFLWLEEMAILIPFRLSYGQGFFKLFRFNNDFSPLPQLSGSSLFKVTVVKESLF